MTNLDTQITEPLRLHIGGVELRAGWKILNIQPGDNVDYVGECSDLSQFGDETVDEVYASHVYEHLGYQEELPRALKEIQRVLKPGGTFRIGVPDLDVLCQLFIHPSLGVQDKFHVMRMMYGGQIDPYDFHKVGLNAQLLFEFLGQAGFTSATKVDSFGLFSDCSEIVFAGVRISLNVEARK